MEEVGTCSYKSVYKVDLLYIEGTYSVSDESSQAQMIANRRACKLLE